MMEQKEKEYRVGKDIFLTILKSLGVFLCLLVLVALGFFVINPKFSAKICANLGWKHLEASCYELVYARSKNNADLYNLIVKLGGINKYDKQSKYVVLLQKNAKYRELCDQADQAVEESYAAHKISAKELSILFATNEYLNSSLATDYLLLNKFDEAYSAVVESISSESCRDRLFELAVYYYVDYLYSKAVSESVFQQYCQKLVEEESIMDYLNTKQVDNNDAMAGTEDKSFAKVLGTKQNVKIAYAKYVLYKGTNQQILADEEYENWQNAVLAYNAQITQ